MSCFDRIRNNIVTNVNSWDDNRKETAYKTLNGGEAILKNQDELDRYVFAFGKMHQAKLNCALNAIDDLNEISKKEISIIDYGCGQGIGSIVLIDYLNALSLDFSISNIKLIEPSGIALYMAKEYIQSCLNIDNMELINSGLNEVKADSLKTNDKDITFHIFSNILDIKLIYENMIKSTTGVNYVVCVSPDYWSGNQKLDEFIGYFRDNLSDKKFIIISERGATIDNPSNPDKPWKNYEKVFKLAI
ncbi:MAG: hypothetical protein HFP77_04965 [Methylococcales symbiont of Iophon sp. n. MRB-2018]|nr:MAG: hypothetical protein HFP77_04965 [Methylococcales symbiont of Iophon sp. n. MRB-2018]KAF3979962.1 MAG: hypothetical protein HFP76_04495 [Methylococcales symbiont of Iophon sp. n. MRB-2018]